MSCMFRVFAIAAGLSVAGAASAQDPEAEAPAAAAPADPTAGGNVVRSGRMEFDARLVKGETAKSGAVYLFKREPRALPPLVPLRVSYRSRIVEPVLGARDLKPVVAEEDLPSFAMPTELMEPAPAAGVEEEVQKGKAKK